MRITNRKRSKRRQEKEVETNDSHERSHDCGSRPPRRSDEQNNQKKRQSYCRRVDVLAKQLQQAGCGENRGDRGAVSERCFVEELKPHWQLDPFGWQLIPDQCECNLWDPEDCR